LALRREQHRVGDEGMINGVTYQRGEEGHVEILTGHRL
jgi:hypothetical protein